ncbi:hypothetical protein A0256_12205 [Mucilaginibacter sp. PAMC 26640]|nr:hypothetical protein A0256_12205 [Mucilaginibacter sp. PAMC 26640]
MPPSITKLFTALCLLSLASGNATAQNLLSKSRQSSYYTYVYQLNDADVLKYYQSAGKSFSDVALHTPVDSFKTDGYWKNILPEGNYVKVYAEQNSLKYTLLENHSAYLKMFVTQREHRFTLADKQGQYISKAVVTLNSKAVSFDDQSATWYFKRAKANNILRVDYAGVSNFFSVADQGRNNYSYYHPTWLKRRWSSLKNLFRKRNHYPQSAYTGFMVFNKPVYKPRDTVKFKAFILNHRDKKPVAQKQLLVKVGTYSSKKTLGIVTAYRQGGFEYSFLLTDSLDLDLDDDYTIELSEIDKKAKPKKDDDDDDDEQTDNKKVMLTGNFKYEEYELKSVKFAMRADKKEHWPGSPLAIYLKATDENDLPVADGRVNLKLITSRVNDYKTNHAFIPDTLWLHKITLDAIGETKVVIPDSIFPKAGVAYDIEAQFLNSNNEEQTEHLYEKFIYRRFNILTEIVNDTLKIKHEEFGKSMVTQAFVSVLNAEGDALSKTKITLPGSILINPSAAEYHIATDSTDIDVSLKEFESNISLSGERTADSVFISINNPRKLPLFYSVFSGGALIDGGKGKTIAYKRAYKSSKPVTFTVNYVWAGQVKKEEASVIYRKDILNLNVKQPVTVYPGQQVTTDIVVTDAAGKPVANADLTAWALTKKFAYNVPYIPYLGKGYKNAAVLNLFRLEDIDGRGMLKLNWARWNREMGLDSITYFKFTHPATLFKIEEPALDSITQVAPFIVKNGNILPVHILFIDEKPVYFSQAQQLNPYSFKVSPGLHTLKFRLDTLLLTLDTVRVNKGRKLIMSINADLLHAVKMKDSLSKYEADLINRYMITVVNNFDQKKSLILQEDRTFFLNPYGVANKTILTGPLSTNFTIFDHKGRGQQFFNAEPGYSFLFEPGLIRQKSIGTPYPFSRYLPGATGGTNYRQQVLTNRMADSIWQDYLNIRSYSQQLFNNPPVKSGKTGQLVYEQLMVKNEKYTLIKNVLIYRYDDPDYLRIYPGNTTDFGSLSAGKYRLFFLLKGDAYDVKENIEVRTNGINHYQFQVRPAHSKDAVSITAGNIISNRSSNTYNNYDYQIENDQLKLKEAFNDKYLDKAAFDQLITGKVTDKDGKEPLVGVNIRVKGTSIGTQTDIHGNFRIKSPTNAKLIITYIGFITKEIDAVIGQPLQINLFASYKSLNEVVVVGYGTTRKKDMTSSVSTVTIQNLLQGQMAGVSITEGAPGAGMEIRIRGNASPGNQKPLYVIDGEIVADLKGISPDMIGEISVLKAAAATALYGSIAANGVILISTKGKTKETAATAADTTVGAGVHSIRKNFADYAYWQPKLTTDENGKTSFTSVFPDDITNWRTFVIGINGNRQSGFSEKQIKSFKPLSANFIAPQFAVVGDEMNLIGKVMNYNATPVKVNRIFSYNGKILKQGNLNISNAKIDTLNITASATDSLEFEYSIIRDNGYYDGERRKIPVIKPGVQETKGIFAALDRDTTLSLKFDPSMGPVTFRAEASALPALAEEARKLRDYKYLCNEQLASKLKGLLSEKRIKSFLDETFNYEKNLLDVIKKLQANRRSTGTWGWWKDSNEELWISLHAVEALLDAKSMGYTVQIDSQKLTDYLIYQMESYHSEDKLVCLQLLYKLGAKANYEKYLGVIAKEYNSRKVRDLADYNRFRLLLLKQEIGFTVKTDSLLTISKATMFGNVYWGEDNYRFFDNSVQLSVLAYKILKNEGKHPAVLAKIRGYFLEQRKKGEWRNTYESALILETILPDLLQNYGQIKPATLTINGASKATITTFPYTTTLKDNNITLSKTGSLPIYITGYQQFWNGTPEKVSKDFTVDTRFEKKGLQVNTLKGGETVELKAEVTARADADFVMIEIPIPAGCSYENKDQQWDNNEVHREFLKEKVSIFCRKLKQGKYAFTVNLMPRYSGNYNLNPAKAEMMYFPVFYGREGMKKVVVGN